MTSKNTQIYTIGFNYVCGNCGVQSRKFKKESGMDLWKRLHFKKNKDCKTYEIKFGLSDGFNTSHRDEAGHTHFVSSARGGEKSSYKVPKGSGHNKHQIKEEIQMAQEQESYALKALTDKNYQLQLLKDKLAGQTILVPDYEAISPRDLQLLKAKKKREKRQRQKNKKKISKSLTPHHF